MGQRALPYGNPGRDGTADGQVKENRIAPSRQKEDDSNRQKPAGASAQNPPKGIAQSGISSASSQKQQTINDYENEVFVSYAWGGESERTVDELEQAFAERGIRIVRDKKDLGYKGSIEAFEQRIGRGQCIVLVISDAYLRSEHCMHELVEADKNQGLCERIFPIVLSDAHLYKPAERANYIKYWQEEIEQLNQNIKQIDKLTGVTGIIAALDKYESIRTNFDRLTRLLSDMNTLTPEMHAAHGYSTLVSAIERVIRARLDSQISGTGVMATQPAPILPEETPPPLTEGYLTTQETAERMDLSVETVRTMCSDGKLSGAMHKQDRWYVPLNAVEAWSRKLSKKPSNSKGGRVSATKVVPIAPETEPGPFVWWQRFRYNPWVFYPITVLSGLIVIVGVLFGLISAGADFGGFSRQVKEWGLVREFPPSAKGKR